MKKFSKIAFLIFFLIILYIYVLVISGIPNNLIVFEGESFNIKTILGINIKTQENNNVVLTSSNIEGKSIEQTGVTKLQVSLFDKIPIKNVNVNVLPKTTVIPVGNMAGVKLYTNGVLVVGMSEIQGVDNNKYKPYENSGIEEGDMIISVSNTQISNTQDLIQTVNKSQGKEVEIEYVRDGKTQECSITPTQTSKTEYKLGLWVRDSAAGVGTVTFYDPSSKMFGALGHGIADIDTGKLINIANGEFVTTKILSIIKGEAGKPGKMQGTVENQQTIGTIYKNTNFGIYGKVDNPAAMDIDTSKEMEVALREEIQTGPATILCSIDGEKIQEYSIEIENVYTNNNYDNKSMLIKVTDEELMQKTGGIIQGMSGAPIIQNEKFIGAVTNVLVNDPLKGYGIFGDLMIKQMKEVE